MNEHPVDIKAGFLFPWYFHLVGVFLLGLAVSMLPGSWIISTLLIIISLFIFTGRSGIEFYTSEYSYRPYYSFLFIKTGKKIKYHKIEKLYINASRVSQKVYTAHTLNSATFKSRQYDAYVKFDDGTKVFLLSSKNIDRLKSELKELAVKCNIDIRDNT